jgi:hypothetical protein
MSGKSKWVWAIMRIAIIVFIIVDVSSMLAQDYNPRWPRIVFQRPRGDTGGTTDQAFARFDWAANSGGGTKGANLAQCVKAINPNIVYLGTAKPQGFWPNSDPADFHLTKSQYAILLQETQGGETEILVSSTEGFPTVRKDMYAFIGDDIFKYKDLEDDKFVDINTTDENLRIEAHSYGDTITMPIRRSGVGMMPNFTRFVPEVNGKKSWEYFVDERFSNTDFSAFDGVFYDAYHIQLWKSMFPDLDLDRNHVNDWPEHGQAWIRQEWAAGVTNLENYERQRFEELHPNKPSIIVVNTGVGEGDDNHERYAFDILNGMKWEGFFRYAYDWDSMFEINQLWEENGRQPVMMMIEDYVKEKNAETGKNDYKYMRYGLTTALVSGAYYGRTFGDYYYIYLYYDEFDTDLGYPTGGPQELPNGCYARFFDRGVAICNPTGDVRTLTNADLQGLSGYDGPYWQLRAGQDPEFNNGSQFNAVELYGAIGSQPKQNRGDGILLFNEPDTVLCPILIGNCHNNDTSPGSVPLETTGNWNTVRSAYDSTVQNPYYSHWNSSDDEGWAHFTAPSGSGSTYAKWTPTIGLAGYYEIAEWHGWVGDYESSVDEATNAPYEVFVNGQRILAGTINFQANIGKWNRIGIAWLPEGSSSYVKVTNKANGTVIADCMQFTYLGQHDISDTTPPDQPKNVKVEHGEGQQ